MQTLNVLIAGTGESYNYIKTSKYLNKLYVTSDIKSNDAIIIKFNTFKELAQKCKALQIDIVIVEEEKWILQGIADVLKSNCINCIAPTLKWSHLVLSNFYTEKLLTKYQINIPPKIILPVDYPIIVKADGFIQKANSIQEIIEIKQNLYNKSEELAKTVYLQKYIEGIHEILISLFDGKTLITIPNKNIPQDLLNIYSKKLESMFISNKADFIGFINSKIIYSDSKIYNTGFSYKFIKPDCSIDILYLLSTALYQKLNEITFS